MAFSEDRPNFQPTTVVGRVVELNLRLIDMLAPESEIRRFPLLLEPEPDMVAPEPVSETHEQMIYRKINVLRSLHATLEGVGLEMYEYPDSNDKDRYWMIQRCISDLYVTERYRVNSASTITDVDAFVSTEIPRRYQDILEMRRFKNSILASQQIEVTSQPSRIRKWGRAIVDMITQPLSHPPKRTTP